MIEVVENILAAMVLAPSAHNTQPWKFAVSGNAIDVYVDWKRHLTVSDPTQRELYASIGCAIMNARVAASHTNQMATVTYFPEGEGDDKPVARIVFSDSEDSKLAHLFESISKRRTNRAFYDGKTLTPEEKAALLQSAQPEVVFVEDEHKKQAIARATSAGTEKMLSRKDFKEELSHWVRNSFTRKPDGMPGYAMGMPAPVSLVAPFMVRVAPIHKQEAPKAYQQITSASAVAVFVTPGDSKKDWLDAGQAMEHLWLIATRSGLEAAPLASAIEAGEQERMKVKTTLGVSGYPQEILRIGHADKVNLKATPRRSINDCLK